MLMKKNYLMHFFAVWTLPFFQHIPGKSFRLKFFMFAHLDFAIFSAYSREKFSVKVFDVCLKHI